MHNFGIKLFRMTWLYAETFQFTRGTVMSKAKVGVSMLYCLGEPFNRMVKRLGTMDTRYIEILDDGTL